MPSTWTKNPQISDEQWQRNMETEKATQTIKAMYSQKQQRSPETDSLEAGEADDTLQEAFEEVTVVPLELGVDFSVHDLREHHLHLCLRDWPDSLCSAVSGGDAPGVTGKLHELPHAHGAAVAALDQAPQGAVVRVDVSKVKLRCLENADHGQKALVEPERQQGIIRTYGQVSRMD